MPFATVYEETTPPAVEEIAEKENQENDVVEETIQETPKIPISNWHVG